MLMITLYILLHINHTIYYIHYILLSYFVFEGYYEYELLLGDHVLSTVSLYGIYLSLGLLIMLVLLMLTRLGFSFIVYHRLFSNDRY